MLATMDLPYSDNVKDISFEEEIEIRIIRIRKGLKDLLAQRVRFFIISLSHNRHAFTSDGHDECDEVVMKAFIIDSFFS